MLSYLNSAKKCFTAHAHGNTVFELLVTVTQYWYSPSLTLLVLSQNTWDRRVRSLRTVPSVLPPDRQ